MKDYYKILGVSKDATQDDIKKAWRQAALQHHPDSGGTEEKFKEVGEAYGILGDPEKRSRYDRGEVGPRQSGFDPWSIHFNTDDIFSNFFKHGQSRQKISAPDIHVEIELELLDAVKGCTKNVKITRSSECSTCNGSGAVVHGNCTACGGTGQKVMRQSPFILRQTCSSCRGTGQVPTKLCDVCNGSGKAPGTEDVIPIDIPAGIENGMRVKFDSKGETKKGLANGDLYILVLVKSHPNFLRIGRDLIHETSVAYSHLILGQKIKIPTIDGEAELKVPPKTRPGSKFRLAGLGIPDIRNPGLVGDLFVVINLQMPENVSAKQKELLKQLLED